MWCFVMVFTSYCIKNNPLAYTHRNGMTGSHDSSILIFQETSMLLPTVERHHFSFLRTVHRGPNFPTSANWHQDPEEFSAPPVHCSVSHKSPGVKTAHTPTSKCLDREDVLYSCRGIWPGLKKKGKSPAICNTCMIAEGWCRGQEARHGRTGTARANDVRDLPSANSQRQGAEGRCQGLQGGGTGETFTEHPVSFSQDERVPETCWPAWCL